MAKPKNDVLQGTLDLLKFRAVWGTALLAQIDLPLTCTDIYRTLLLLEVR